MLSIDFDGYETQNEQIEGSVFRIIALKVLLVGDELYGHNELSKIVVLLFKVLLEYHFQKMWFPDQNPDLLLISRMHTCTPPFMLYCNLVVVSGGRTESIWC